VVRFGCDDALTAWWIVLAQGSTHGRLASDKERAKSCPTFKVRAVTMT
jgi:hypothetical protein